MKKILGISAFYHDSAAAIIVDGKIIAAAQEERFTREKHTSDFPENSIKFCLEQTGLDLTELDAIVFYDKPLLKFERLIETYFSFSPKGIASFLKAMPVWLKDKLFLKKIIRDKLSEISKFEKRKLKILFTEHHLAHAASAFYPSNYSEAAILTIDGVGEWCTTSICYGKDRDITILKELHFPHSVGLLYSSFTYYLGFTVNSGEYKLMGLAPYGNFESEYYIKFVNIIKEHLVDIKSDGSIWINQQYFEYATGIKMVDDKKWNRLFGFCRRKPESEILQLHCDFALAIQHVTEEIVFKLALEAKKITGSENLCLAGGVALNCVANGKLVLSNIFKNIFIQPAAGDAGGALGAALACLYVYFGENRLVDPKIDPMQGTYLGPEYSQKEILLMSLKAKAVWHKYEEFSELCDFIAYQISIGKIVGWFQGRMEFGPRALGNRSILGDARNAEMQKKINLSIKYREGFRPFAPSVLSEKAGDYFDLKSESPYMLIVAPVNISRRVDLPSNFNNLALMEKLYSVRSDIPAVTHLDYSSRIQTVCKVRNPLFWELLNSYNNLTGIGLLVNTSFNVRGEPIVCSPNDAYNCFMSTEMDILVINNFVYLKSEQKEGPNKQTIRQFKLD